MCLSVHHAWIFGNKIFQAVLVSRRFLADRKNLNMDKCEKREGHEGGLPFLFSLLWVLSNTSSSLSVLISITYWAALYNPELDNLDFNNFSGHLFLAIIHVVDIFFSYKCHKS